MLLPSRTGIVLQGVSACSVDQFRAGTIDSLRLYKVGGQIHTPSPGTSLGIPEDGSLNSSPISKKRLADSIPQRVDTVLISGLSEGLWYMIGWEAG